MFIPKAQAKLRINNLLETEIQSAKLLLVQLKYEIIMVPSNHSCSNIGFFSNAPCKVITLNILCFIYAINFLFLFLIVHSKVIALPIIMIAIVIALSRS